jgi:cytochrome c
MLNQKPIKAMLAALVLGATVVSFGQNPEEVKLNVKQKPDDNRFTPVVLAQDLDEPMVFEVTKSGKVYIAERKGGFKVFDPITETTKTIAMIPVNTKYASAAGVVREAEEGLVGMTLDPGFETNHFVYLFYAHPTISKFVLTRSEMVDDKLVPNTEKTLLEFASQRETCCHTGGGMTWDAKGNLYLTVGNNTGNVQGSQTDERPGRANWDDQRGSANTNDLRGKILRIHPEPNGTYTIPAGNLFPVGTPRTRPEIYTMGHRNVWRPSIDSKTGYLYWGEVGPDASTDTELGTRGYDEQNQAKGPGFFGWPYFVGENNSYPIMDYATGKIGQPKDPKKPMNTSINNTGITELPPAQPAFISYPYAPSERFPLVGTGGRSSTGGPVYHKSDFGANAKAFPDYYEGKWLTTDLARGWIMAISMDGKSDYVSMEKFLPTYHPVEPIDMKFGPDGSLYVLEYGSTWFAKSSNSQLVKVEYNAGNRPPLVQVAASKSGGNVPAKIKLSSEGTKDNDGDALKYEWKVALEGGGDEKTYTQASPEVTLSKPGVYTASLTVTDAKGAKASKSVKMIAGNEPPVVGLALGGNKTFFSPGKAIDYTVSVSDKEDGTIESGKISQDKVAVSIDYASEGFDYAEVVQGQRSVDASARFAVAQALIAKTDCKVCHQIDTKSVGPAFTAIAEKYKGDQGAIDKLAAKVRNGGSGVWGEVAMAAHPALSVNDATTIVKYILSSNDKTISTLPVKGTYTQQIPAGDNGKGTLIVRAAYTDAGGKSSPSITSENQLILRSPSISASSAEIIKGGEVEINARQGTTSVAGNPNGHIGFKKIDMTGIKQLELTATAVDRTGNTGGNIEVRLDSPTGELLGQIEVKVAAQQRGGGGAQAAQDAGGATGQRAGGTGVAPGAAGGGASAPAAGQRAGAAAANPFGGAGAGGLKVDIKEVSGVHDVYFVFKNDKVKPGANLFSLSTIKFSDEKK